MPPIHCTLDGLLNECVLDVAREEMPNPSTKDIPVNPADVVRLFFVDSFLSYFPSRLKLQGGTGFVSAHSPLR